MLKIVNNFFDKDTLQSLQNSISNNRLLFKKNTYWQSNLQTTTPVFVRNFYSYGEIVHDIVPPDVVKKVVERLSAEIEEDSVVSGISFHLFPPNSYVPWHNDASYTEGITVYLNEHWDEGDGGFFLCKENAEEQHLRGVVPKENLGVVVTGGLLHCTTPVHPHAKNARITLQCFTRRRNEFKDADKQQTHAY